MFGFTEKFQKIETPPVKEFVRMFFRSLQIVIYKLRLRKCNINLLVLLCFLIEVDCLEVLNTCRKDLPLLPDQDASERTELTYRYIQVKTGVFPFKL